MLRFRQQMLRSGTREGSGSISEEERGYPTTLAEPWPLSPQTLYPRGRARTLCNPHAPADPVLIPWGTGQPTLGNVFRLGAGSARSRLASATCFLSLSALSLAQPWPPSFRPPQTPQAPASPWASGKSFVVNNTSQSCGNIIIKIYIN